MEANEKVSIWLPRNNVNSIGNITNIDSTWNKQIRLKIVIYQVWVHNTHNMACTRWWS